MENWRGFLKEEHTFDPSKFPFPAPATQQQADKIASGGSEDGVHPEDDQAVVTHPDNLSVTKLKPSQTAIKLGQSLGMATDQLVKGEIGGNLGAVISTDLYIMDGHHRWAATIFAAGEKGKVGGILIDIPGEQLVKVLAAVGDHFHPGVRKGASTVSIFDAQPDDIDPIIDKLIAEGNKYAEPPFSGEQAKEAFEKNFGSVEQAKEVFKSRLPLIQKEPPPSWAENRDKMPVLEPEKGEPEKAGIKIKRGEVDIYAPYKK